MRPDVDDYFLKIAKDVSLRSTCLHRHVGALIVKDGQIIAAGYNGSPSGDPHCTDIGCSKPEHAKEFEKCRAVHAEVNAIIQAALHGVSIQGAVMYCTHEPCVMCARVLKNARIEKIIFAEKYE